jgi:hypothetical protein
VVSEISVETPSDGDKRTNIDANALAAGTTIYEGHFESNGKCGGVDAPRAAERDSRPSVVDADTQTNETQPRDITPSELWTRIEELTLESASLVHELRREVERRTHNFQFSRSTELRGAIERMVSMSSQEQLEQSNIQRDEQSPPDNAAASNWATASRAVRTVHNDDGVLAHAEPVAFFDVGRGHGNE